MILRETSAFLQKRGLEYFSGFNQVPFEKVEPMLFTIDPALGWMSVEEARWTR